MTLWRLRTYLFRFRRGRVYYGCGNCRQWFRSEEARAAHYDSHGVCPQLTLEWEVAAWNKRMTADIEAIRQEHEIT